MPVLQINQLSKAYGRIQAVNGLQLTIEKGQVFGLLGPNGSGKTTTLGIILGILTKDGGDFTWFEGQYGEDHRRHLGAILETPNFYPYLDAEQNLAIIAQIKNINQTNFDRELTIVDLLPRKHSKFQTYSLGMKQRLAIAATLVGDPQVLIFDEPTNGLDPQGIAEIRDIIKSIAQTGKTVIMASHILDEVEKICSHVAIIKNGKLLSSGPIGSILTDDNLFEVGSENMEQLEAFLNTLSEYKLIKHHQNFIECSVSKALTPSQLNQAAFQNGITITHLIHRKRKLEEEFLAIVRQNQNA